MLARAVAGPPQLAARNANYVGGDIACGAFAGLQTLIRPKLARVPYATAHPAVFLCSSATPPGPGVHACPATTPPRPYGGSCGPRPDPSSAPHGAVAAGGGGIRNGRAAPGVVDPVTIRRTRPPAFRYDAGAQRRCAAPPNWLPSTVPTPIAAVVTKASTA